MAIKIGGTSSDFTRAASHGITGLPITYSFWGIENGGTLNVFAWTGREDVNTAYLWAGTENGQAAIHARAGGGTVGAFGGTITVGVPFHIVAVFAGTSNRKLYLNGVQVASSTTNVLQPASYDSIVHGRLNDASPSNSCDGTIWDFALYNTSLNDDEVMALYTGHPFVVRPQQLVRYWAWRNIAGNADEITGVLSTLNGTITTQESVLSSPIGWFPGEQIDDTAAGAPTPDLTNGAQFNGTQRVALAPFAVGTPTAVNQWALSFWFKRTGNPSGNEYIVRHFCDATVDGSEVTARVASSGTLTINVVLRNAGGNGFFHNAASLCDGNWHHVMVVWQIDASGGASWVAVDGVRTAKTNSGAQGYDIVGPAGFIDSELFVVGSFSPTAQSSPFQGCVSEVWFKDVHFTNADASVQKFRDATGNRVSLGSTGQTPSGSSALVYLSGGVGNFAQNFGTVGTFTLTGALADCPVAMQIPLGSLAHAHTLEQTLVSGAAQLAPNDLVHAHTLEQALVAALSPVVPQGLAHAHTLEQALVAALSPVTPNALSHAHPLEQILVTALSPITPSALAHAHTLEQALVAALSPVAPQDLVHGQSVTAVAVVPEGSVAPQDLQHAVLLESAQLSAQYVLVPIDLAHTHELAQTSLTASTPLTPQSLQNAQLLDQVAVLPSNAIVPSALLQAHQLGEPGLVLFGVPIGPSSLLHAHFIGGSLVVDTETKFIPGVGRLVLVKRARHIVKVH